MINMQSKSWTMIKEISLAVCTFVTANLFTSLWHEMGHALCVRAFQLNGIMYHNCVQYDTGKATIARQALITLAGSGSSLIELLFSWLILRFVKVENRILKMYVIWLLFWSIIQCLGYILIGAFPFSNDFSILYHLLHIPVYARIILAIGAVVLLRMALVKLNGTFARIMNAALGDKRTLAFIYFIIVPLCSTAIIVFANLPTKSFASIIYPLVTPLYALFNFKSIRKNTTLTFGSYLIKNDQIVLTLVIMFILVGLFRLVALGVKI